MDDLLKCASFRAVAAQGFYAMLTLAASLWAKFIGLPKWAQYVAYALALIAAFFAAKAAYDASVIEDHEAERTAAGIEAIDDSAEQRAHDAITSILAEKAREEAIATAEASEAAKPPEQRATVAPQTRAYLCAAMREEYPARELARMEAYQRECR